ncbi:MAG: hypothetical protein RLZZ192_1603 [Pseudomonadota bacterium]|jgi:hypothetical protein
MAVGKSALGTNSVVFILKKPIITMFSVLCLQKRFQYET